LHILVDIQQRKLDQMNEKRKNNEQPTPSNKKRINKEPISSSEKKEKETYGNNKQEETSKQ
jgi:hypothetical protein